MAIIEKIAQIRKTLAIEKTGHDLQNNYYYFKADDIAMGVRRAMVENDVIHRTELVQWSSDNVFDKNGRNRPRQDGVYRITFIDVADGSEFSTEASATGSDTGGDKAPRKMAVQAFKVACIDIFTIVEGMGGFDSDTYAEEKVSEPEEAKSSEPTSKELGDKVAALIADENFEAINAEAVMAVGRRVAESILGKVPADRVWRKDARVLAQLVKELENGALS